MPQAISWITEFPLCFLGEMVGEINRKNIVTNPSRCHDSLLGPGQPLHPPPRQQPGGSAAHSLLRCFEIPGRTPQLAAGSPPLPAVGKAGARIPSSGTHLGQPGGFPNPPPSFQPHLPSLSFPQPAWEALFCSLGRRGTLRSVHGDGEKEHDVHPKTQTLGVICSGWGSKAPFHF